MSASRLRAAALFLITSSLALLATEPRGWAAPAAPARPLPGGNCVVRPIPPELMTPDAADAARRFPPAAAPVLPALDPRFATRQSLVLPGHVIPVIMMDFANRTATHTPADIQARVFGTGPDPSVRTFYRENSFGQYDLNGVVVGWFRSRYGHDFYTTNDSANYGFGTDQMARTSPYNRNVWGAINEAVDLADPTVNFADYDYNHDGVVDAVIFVFGGQGAEEVAPDPRSFLDFWSHKFDLRQCLTADYCPARTGVGLMTQDGVAIGPYLVVPDVGQIGVWCHEYGHILGLPDLYSPYDAYSYIDQMGAFDIMDEGEWLSAPTGDPGAGIPGSLPCELSAWCKYTLGWMNPGSDSGAVASRAAPGSASSLPLQATLPPVESAEAGAGGALRLLATPGGADWVAGGGGQGRYFLVENRQNLGFDRSLFARAPMLSRASEGGLLITFVDESEAGNDALGSPLLSVMQADGEGLDSNHGLPSSGEATDLWPRDGHSPDEFSPATASGHGISDPELALTRVTGMAMGSGGAASLTVEQGDGSAALLPASPVRVAGVSYPYPNPAHVSAGAVYLYFQPRSGDLSGLRARIYSLDGRLVRTLDSGAEIDPGGAQARWDFRDESGHTVASGLYVYVIEAGGERARNTIAVIH